MRLKTCSTCKETQKENSDAFCFNCGTRYEANHCTNKDCENSISRVILGNNYCFCTKCGAKSSYYENKYIQINEDLPF